MDRRMAESEAKLTKVFQDALAQTKVELTESLQEFVRDVQTELLRGFQAFANAFDTRVSKLNADVSILDQATERRLVTLERRMLEIENRLPPMPPPPLTS